MARLHAERSWGDIDSTLTPRQVQLLQKGGAFKRGPTGARAGGGAGGWRKATRAAVGATVSRRQPKGSLLQNVRQKTGAEHAAIRPQSMKQARNFKPELQPAPPAPLQITLTADGRLAKVSTDGGSRSPRQPTILLRTQSLDIDSYSVAVPPRTASSPRSRLQGTVSAVAPRHIMRALSLDDAGPPSSPRSPKIVPAARPTGLPGTPTSSRPAALGTVFGKMQRPDPAAEPSEEESPDDSSPNRSERLLARRFWAASGGGAEEGSSRTREMADHARHQAKQKKTADTLEKKLGLYEESKRRLDKMAAATGVRKDGHADAVQVQVGEKCEVYSESTGTYVPATVVGVREDDEASDVESTDEVEVKYVGSDGEERTRWVSVTSSEFKRAAPAAAPLSAEALNDTEEFLKKRQKYRLGPWEKARARAVVMRVPETRKPDTIKEMVAWTYSADIFHGLTEKERKKLCLEARGEVVEENGTLIAIGQDKPGIWVVVSGECAIYTMRKMDFSIEKSATDSAKQSALRDKFQNMQRRTSMTVRRESSVVNQMGQLQHAATISERRRSVAVGMSQADQGPVTGSVLSSRRGRGGAPSGPPEQGDGIMFPVRMVFSEGDALGAQRAFHNMDERAVRQDGYKKADHTVSALTQVTCMVFDHPKHIAMFEKAHYRNLQDKIELLSQVQNYTMHPRESLEAMARFCARRWYNPGDRIMTEGEEAEHVYYVVHGQLSVIKDVDTPQQKNLAVIGRGAWCARPEPAPCPCSPDPRLLPVVSATGGW